MSIMLANFGKYAISDCPFITLSSFIDFLTASCTVLVAPFRHWLQEHLMVVSRESRSLHTLSRDLLHLERFHVTRNGDECDVGRTSDTTINYFCHETLGSMNSLIDALSDFHHKLENVVSSQKQMSYAITTINCGLNLENMFSNEIYL